MQYLALERDLNSKVMKFPSGILCSLSSFLTGFNITDFHDLLRPVDFYRFLSSKEPDSLYIQLSFKPDHRLPVLICQL